MDPLKTFDGLETLGDNLQWLKVWWPAVALGLVVVVGVTTYVATRVARG